MTLKMQRLWDVLIDALIHVGSLVLIILLPDLMGWVFSRVMGGA